MRCGSLTPTEQGETQLINWKELEIIIGNWKSVFWKINAKGRLQHEGAGWIQCLGISGFAAPVQQVQSQLSGILGEKKTKPKTKSSFLSSSVPQNKRGSGRRWTGTLPDKSILFLTLQGSSGVIQGLPILPWLTAECCLEQGVLGFGSGSSLRTQVSLFASRGVFVVHKAATFGLGGFSCCFLGWVCHPPASQPGAASLAALPKSRPVLGRARLGRWGGPRAPSQVRGCCLQVAQYPNPHRPLSLGAFEEGFHRFCSVFRALAPRIGAGTSSYLRRRSCAPFPPSPPPRGCRKPFQQQ